MASTWRMRIDQHIFYQANQNQEKLLVLSAANAIVNEDLRLLSLAKGLYQQVSQPYGKDKNLLLKVFEIDLARRDFLSDNKGTIRKLLSSALGHALDDLNLSAIKSIVDYSSIHLLMLTITNK